MPPEKIIEEANKRGLSLIGISDHDTAGGVMRAAYCANRIGQPFISSIEFEAEFSEELHILGLGINPLSAAIKRFDILQTNRRRERNELVIKKLSDDGMDITPYMPDKFGVPVKSDIAAALVKAGFCETTGEAFSKLLVRGRSYYVPMEHSTMPEIMDIIIEAGGAAVLAHPVKMHCDHARLIEDMTDRGLWGIEAYYGNSSSEQAEYFASLGKRYGLRLTCGSDFHGFGNSHGSMMGSGWCDCEELEVTEWLLKERFGINEAHPAGRLVKDAFRRGPFTEDEFQLIAERITAELPDDFYKGLNGGVVISDRVKLHKRSRPERPLYILGEYHHGGNEGHYITLYYGSFVKAHGQKRGSELENEIRKVILHEFRHHLETRGGEHDLEYEDEAAIAEYEEQ